MAAAAFSEIDWHRFDFRTLAGGRGLAVVDTAHAPAYRAWLKRNDYAVESLDFGGGVGPAVEELGRLLNWEEQFGYVLTRDNYNLNAIVDGFREGFELTPRPESGLVFELLNAEVAYAERPLFLTHLLSIASGHAIRRLALGGRFFTTLILGPNSPLIGHVYDSHAIPGRFWLAHRENPFEDDASNEEAS
jgi:hypothetical protein